MTSAVGTRFAGLFPATWTPKTDSDGCRRTRDHSSLEPARKEVARPTERGECPYQWSTGSCINDLLSPQVISAPKSTQRRRKGYKYHIVKLPKTLLEIDKKKLARFPTVVNGARSIRNTGI